MTRSEMMSALKAGPRTGRIDHRLLAEIIVEFVAPPGSEYGGYTWQPGRGFVVYLTSRRDEIGQRDMVWSSERPDENLEAYRLLVARALPHAAIDAMSTPLGKILVRLRDGATDRVISFGVSEDLHHAGLLALLASKEDQ